MNTPKFSIDQQVKFKGDPDHKTGKVISISYTSEEGYSYKVSSRFFDSQKNDMIEGHIMAKEDELVDMSGYTGTTEPQKADVEVQVADNV